ncbi:MAG: DUF2911 domain-containing protein [Bacteroidota bacterium]
MYNNTLLICLLLVSTFACNNTTNSNTANKAGIMSQPASTPETTAAPKSGDYTITILEQDLPSPRKEMTGTIKGINITVNYGSPAVKERELWGTLVPYDKVWRTGANEATYITTDQDIVFNDQLLKAGTYGLFTIPTATEWQVIFNLTSDQWGAYEYDSEKDVLRMSILPQKDASSTEHLDFTILDDKLVLNWGTLKLPIPIIPA